METPESSMGAALFGVLDSDIHLVNYIRLSQPLSMQEHLQTLLGVTWGFDDSLSLKLGGEIKYGAITHTYQAYLLNRSHIGVSIGTITAKRLGAAQSLQKVYISEFNVRNENTPRVVDEVARRYSKFGEVFPKKNFTYDEMMRISEAGGMEPHEISEGIDVATDIGLMEPRGLEKRIVGGRKILVPTFAVPLDVKPPLDFFAGLVGADDGTKLKRVLPQHFVNI